MLLSILKTPTYLQLFKMIQRNSTHLQKYFFSNSVSTSDLIDRYGISMSQMTTYMFHLSETLPDPFLIHDLSPGL